jgi:steroid 5-alpha reductase family enzyme
MTYSLDYDYPFHDLLIVSAISLAVVVGLMVLTAVLTKLTGRVSVVDTIWGIGFIAVAATSTIVGLNLRPTFNVALSGLPDGVTDPLTQAAADVDHQQYLRAIVLVSVVLIWGGRLAWHIGRRSHGGGEDPRYTELMEGHGGLTGLVKKVLLPQGLAIWFVSLPIQVSSLSGTHVAPVLWIGVALFVVGLLFESVGDAQLAAYKKDPNRSKVMDRGLWRYTRHPNYFGDACVWWGIYLVCASSWPGVFTILSPVAMTYFLVFATGARLLERTMMQREGYPEYAARTSMFFPLPPKK